VVYSELEVLRNKKEINKNNQAYIELSFNNTFNFKEEILAKYLNVAKVKFVDQKAQKITAKVADAKLARCERC
jgi:predicted HTH transcriptional regulator